MIAVDEQKLLLCLRVDPTGMAEHHSPGVGALTPNIASSESDSGSDCNDLCTDALGWSIVIARL